MVNKRKVVGVFAITELLMECIETGHRIKHFGVGDVVRLTISTLNCQESLAKGRIHQNLPVKIVDITNKIVNVIFLL